MNVSCNAWRERVLGTAVTITEKSLREPFLVLNVDVLTRLDPSHLYDFIQNTKH